MSEVCIRPCDTVTKVLLPRVTYGSFKRFKISSSGLLTMSMRRRMRACADEFLAMVTEGLVHGVRKVVTRSSFSVILPHNWATVAEW